MYSFHGNTIDSFSPIFVYFYSFSRKLFLFLKYSVEDDLSGTRGSMLPPKVQVLLRIMHISLYNTPHLSSLSSLLVKCQLTSDAVYA